MFLFVRLGLCKRPSHWVTPHGYWLTLVAGYLMLGLPDGRRLLDQGLIPAQRLLGAKKGELYLTVSDRQILVSQLATTFEQLLVEAGVGRKQ